MTKSPKRKNLELNVANFGPIARANIDLRPMTVFVGPSNTGKSYLAILIYALHRFFGLQAIGPSYTPRHRRRTIFSMNDKQISCDDIAGLASGVGKVLPKLRTGDSSPVTLPEPVASLVRRRLEDVGDFGHTFDAEIAYCFGVNNTSQLVRNQIRNEAKVVVSRRTTDMAAAPESNAYDFTIRRNVRNLTASIPATTDMCLIASERQYRNIRLTLLWLRIAQESEEDEDDIQRLANALVGELAGIIGPDIVSPLSRAAHYLPANRAGIIHAQRVVAGSTIGQASRVSLPSDPLLTGVLADFLEQLMYFDDSEEGDLDRKLARHIERDILHGKVYMKQSVGGHPEFFYRPTGWTDDLRLMHASSMVSELAPVVLYLRYVVRPGDVLIIEEPESHMHPAMQVEFIRHLASAVRTGVRIILTTHSEWVLDELANLVRLSDLSNESRKGIVREELALSRDEVGVWLFEPKQSPKGSVVGELPLSEEYGGFASDFNEVAMGTYNDWARVANLIEELGGK